VLKCWQNFPPQHRNVSHAQASNTSTKHKHRGGGGTACRAMEKQLVAGVLPAVLFQNGHTYFVQRVDKPLGIQPYAVHASFIAGKNVKIFHFRESLLGT